MRMFALLALATAVVWAADLRADDKAPEVEEGFVSLFNGKDLTGWKVSENPESVRVEDGVIVLHGPRAHAFYAGPVKDADFKNFELRLEVKTTPQANSGVYFHTKYQESGWPDIGYEAQINATHRDAKKGGGLYGVQDIAKSPVGDGEWWTYTIIVKDKQIVLKVNDETTVDYTEPENVGRRGRVLDSGTFALQAHDPGAATYIRNIRVKPLD